MSQREVRDRAILLSGDPSPGYHPIIEVMDLAERREVKQEGLLFSPTP